MSDSAFYRSLEKASGFFFLNFLWLIACLPLVTFFPATTAMFSVVRHWRKTDDYQVFFLFFRSFRDHFKPNLIIGVIWLLVAGIIVINYRSISVMPATLQIVSYSVNTFALLAFSTMTVYLFPILAHFQIAPKLALKLAFVLSHQRLATTGQCLLLIAVVVSLAFMIPITLLITGSVLAFVVYGLCSRTFPQDAAFPVQP